MTVAPRFSVHLLSFAFLLAGASTFAAPRGNAPEFDTRSWTTKDGLPDDSITCIQQTADGFLWVGTKRGLARFDGWTFVLVEISSEETLPKQILPISLRNVWIPEINCGLALRNTGCFD